MNDDTRPTVWAAPAPPKRRSVRSALAGSTALMAALALSVSAAPRAAYAEPAGAGAGQVQQACALWNQSQTELSYRSYDALSQAATSAQEAATRSPHWHQLATAMSLLAKAPETGNSQAAASRAKAAITVIDAACPPSQSASATPLSVNGSTAFPNDQTSYDFFVQKGLTNYEAAGIVGNLDQESGDNPAAIQGGGCNPCGEGIAQWSIGGRWDTDANDNVVWFSKTLAGDPSPTGLEPQLEFTWYELTTFSGYGLSSLESAGNVTNATIAFENDFEGCGQCDQSNRITYAEDVLAAYGSQGPPAPSPAAGANLLSNADFVVGTTGWGYRPGMSVSVASTGGLPEGSTVMSASPGSAGSQAEVAQMVSASVPAEGSYDASVWIRAASGGTGTGQVIVWGLGDTATDNGGTTFAVGSNWTQVDVPYVARGGHAQLQLSIYLQSPGVQYQILGAQLAPDALSNADFVAGTAGWGYKPGMSVAAASANGLPEGSTVLSASPGSAGSGAELAQVVNAPVTVNASYDASVWIRAASGGTGTGQVIVWGLGDTPTDNGGTTFAVGSNWTQVDVPYVARSGHAQLQLSIYLQSPGDQYQILGARLAPDALSNADFVAGTAGWGYKPGMVVSVASGGGLPEGNTVLSVNPGSAGSSSELAQVMSAPVTVNASYDASVWIRAVSGGTGTGQVIVWGLGDTPADNGGTTFAVGPNWTQVDVPYVARSGHAQLQLSIYLQSPGVQYQILGAQLGRTP
jgi:hypothetical protein